MKIYSHCLVITFVALLGFQVPCYSGAPNKDWLSPIPRHVQFAFEAGGFLLVAGLSAYVASKIQQRMYQVSHIAQQIDGSSITLKDYIGEVPEEILDLVDQLKDPEKYSKMKVKVTNGVLLFGPSGSGKTYLARAVAGEVGCPFFAINGTDFSQTFVGQGKNAVLELFAQAKKVAKQHVSKTAIIFIDEFDSIGSRDGSNITTTTNSIEVINTLLSEMDGFYTSDVHIIVMAATNLPGKIDSALIRAGRLDYYIHVAYPDQSKRQQLIENFLKKYPSDNAISSVELAEATEGMSPADIVLLFESAGRIAVRLKKSVRDENCFQQALAQIKASRA